VVVYADLLFLENLLANCFIIKLASLISGFQVKLWKLLLSASFGSIYAVMTIIFSSEWLSSLLVKMVISMVMVVIAFRIGNVMELLRRWGMLLLSAFLLAGSTYAFSGILGGSMVTYAGFMYLSPKGLLKAFVFAAGLSILLVKPIGRILSGKALREGSIVPVFINMGNKSIKINALVDTGNSLVDPLTGYPVVIVEAESIKEIFPPDIYNLFLSNKVLSEAISDNDQDSVWRSRVHLIPFKSIGRENGMLNGFRPDTIKVLNGSDFKEVKNVIVGICGMKLSNSSRYTALLGPALLASTA